MALYPNYISTKLLSVTKKKPDQRIIMGKLFLHLGKWMEKNRGVLRQSVDLDFRCASGLRSFSFSFSYSAFLSLERRKRYQVLFVPKTAEAEQ